MVPIFEIGGFHFVRTAVTTRDGENLFMVVKLKNRSKVYYPQYSIWEYSEEEFVEHINSFGIKCVCAILDDFSMLERCQCIEMLDVYPSFQAPKNVSYEPVYEMQNLRMLQPRTVYGYDDKYHTEFDCARLKSAGKLEDFDADCRKYIKNMDALTNLRSLCISSFREPTLENAVGSPVLDTLWMFRSSVENLRGLERSRALTAVKIDTCPQLKNIDALCSAKDTLHGLVLENCRNIEDYSVLGELTELTRLSILGTCTIPSLSFIKNLPKLRSVFLSGTVVDGDLSYCDGLENVTISQGRRHYNRKYEDFNQLRRPYVIFGDEGIDEWRQNVLR